MSIKEFDHILSRTLDDRKVSRAEKKVLTELMREWELDSNKLARLRSQAFEVARKALRRTPDKEILNWLEDILKLLEVNQKKQEEYYAEALFSPGNECRNRIIDLIRTSFKKIDICVYTITDDTIAQAIVDAHHRRVSIRILTDLLKSSDLGSDINFFESLGIPVARDSSEKHMHHKFAVFDGAVVLTGSYNWTRSAALHNEENIVVTNDRRLLDSFQEEFEALWKHYF